jgi:monoterpene epsilon-lactone hydrolase
MTGRPAPPIPTTVSEQAQRFLATPFTARRRDELPLDDVDGWLRQIEATDAYLVERFGGTEFPVEVRDIEIAGVRTFLLRSHDVLDDPSTPVYLDIHGGALIAGGGEACRLMGSATAMTTGMIDWAVDYRMPPLHPYPTPLDDCMAVYRALLAQRSPEDVFVGGSSAGGNLAAALVVRAKEEGLPLPAGLVLVSPEVDLTESGDSFSTNLGIDHVLGSLMHTNLLYAQGHDLADPHLSPLFADVTGFPPTFLQCGTRDLFLSNTVRMHRKLRDAGVEAELHVWEAMPHGGFAGAPEDVEVRVEMRRFLDRLRRNRRPPA